VKKIRWGIIGSGRIVRRWLCGAKQRSDMEVVAVASRHTENARQVADTYGIPYVEENVQSLLDRKDIDIVYIAVPHTVHYEMTMLALRKGKHVLCEKPLSINGRKTAEMFAEAKKRRLFLMEAMWMRFFPALEKAKEIFDHGDLGRLRSVTATFGFDTDADRSDRLLNPQLAGGALLDVGVYCLQFCDVLFDTKPVAIEGYASINSDDSRYGIDEQDFVIARYPGSVIADLRFAVKNELGNEAVLSFTNGKIIFDRFWSPDRLTVLRGEHREVMEFPVNNTDPLFRDEGFQYEIAHVNECLRDGLTESPVMTPERTNRTLESCDYLRKLWNLTYPQDFM